MGFLLEPSAIHVWNGGEKEIDEVMEAEKARQAEEKAVLNRPLLADANEAARLQCVRATEALAKKNKEALDEIARHEAEREERQRLEKERTAEGRRLELVEAEKLKTRV